MPELAALTYPTTDSPRLTVRHPLSHAEGFPEDNPWGDRQLAATDDDMSRMMRQGIPFSTAPGTAYEYSNYGFAILGRIVARVSGVPYADYVSRQILTPLGMTATTLEPASVPRDRLARGYRWEDGGWKEEPPLPDGAFGPMGGMVTSTKDLARYVGFLMSAWPPRDDPETGPIRRSSAREMQQVWRPSPAVVTRDTVDAPLRLNTGGYGFGLRVSQTCGISHQVAHSGGLPGFGSHMRWLPDHGVAFIAMGNLTYTSWGRVTDDAIDLLAQTGGLQARLPQPSPALLDARDGVNRLLGAWDDGLADRLAADNLFLDRSKAARKQGFGTVRAELGVCRPAGELAPENALRGRWTLACERGTLNVAVTLAPTVPPKVQFLEVVTTTPLGPLLAPVVTRIAGLIGAQKPAGAALASMLAPAADAAGAGRQIDAASAWGTCAVGEVIRGGGELSARVRLVCTRGHLDLTVRRDVPGGRLTLLRLEPSGDRTCGQ